MHGFWISGLGRELSSILTKQLFAKPLKADARTGCHVFSALDSRGLVVYGFVLSGL